MGGARWPALIAFSRAGYRYKDAVRSTFLLCARKFGHWSVVPCADEDGSRRSREHIANAVWNIFQDDFVNKNVPTLYSRDASA